MQILTHEGHIVNLVSERLIDISWRDWSKTSKTLYPEKHANGTPVEVFATLKAPVLKKNFLLGSYSTLELAKQAILVINQQINLDTKTFEMPKEEDLLKLQVYN